MVLLFIWLNVNTHNFALFVVKHIILGIVLFIGPIALIAFLVRKKWKLSIYCTVMFGVMVCGMRAGVKISKYQCKLTIQSLEETINCLEEHRLLTGYYPKDLAELERTMDYKIPPLKIGIGISPPRLMYYRDPDGQYYLNFIASSARDMHKKSDSDWRSRLAD